MNRPIAFVLASSDHGTMIVNRNDYQMSDPTSGIGVGFDILNCSAYDRPGVGIGTKLLHLRRKHFGDGVVAIDCGANIGVMTVEWARAMTGWGRVVAVEAQERTFYALAGNIALNNLFNASALHAAVGESYDETMIIPQLDPSIPSNFGGLELRPRNGNWVGQPFDALPPVFVNMVTVDSLVLPRVDLIKIDVEGMEPEALEGAEDTIARDHPMMIVECIRNGEALRETLTGMGYRLMRSGINFVAIHESDPGLAAVKQNEREAA
jgi:FkbM family methyltransferase